MRNLPLLVGQACDRLWSAPVLRNSGKAHRAIERCDDAAVLAPTRSALAGRFAQSNGHAADNADLFQLEFGEKTHPLAVRREKRTVGVVGSWNGRCLGFVEGAG